METRNTFENGMHTDNDFQAQPKETYRDNQNGVVFSSGGNNYVWKPSDGTKILPGMPSGPSIYLGAIPARERLIVFHHNTGSNLDYIGQIVKENGEDVYSVLYVENLGFTEDNPISGYSYFEDNETEKIYWTDGNVKPKSLNILGFTVFEWPTENNEGKKYLVRSGWIKHQGSYYYAGDSFVFWTISGFSWGTDGIGLIEYIEPVVLDWDPLMLYNEDISISALDGKLTPAQYIIAYRYITLGNHATPWSQFIEPITIQVLNGVKDYATNNHNDVKEWLYHQSGELVTKGIYGIEITINNIPIDKYKFIELVAFKFTEEGTGGTGVIFDKIDIENELTFSLPEGETNVLSITTSFQVFSGLNLTIEDYLSQSITINKVEDIDQILQTNVIAGIGEELDIDIGQKMEPKSGINFKTCVYDIPLDVIGNPNINTDEPLAGIFGLRENYSVRYNHILYGQYYLVKSGSVEYESVTYNTGDVFAGNEHSEMDMSSDAIVVPVIRICKYSYLKEGIVTPVFKYIESGFESIPKGFTTRFISGYWGEETYRFGILPISKTGKQLPVRFLGDHTIEHRNSRNAAVVNQIDSNGNFISVINNLTRFEELKDITDSHAFDQVTGRYNTVLVTIDLTDIIDEISGFSIVRVKRENGIVSEGICEPIHEISYKTFYNDNGDVFVRCPYFNFGKYHWKNLHKKTSKKSYIYISPEHLFGDGLENASTDTYKLKRILDSRYSDNYIEFDPPEDGSYLLQPRYRCLKSYFEDLTTEITSAATSVKSITKISPGDVDISVAGEDSKFRNYSVQQNGKTEEGGTREYWTGFDGAGHGTLINLKDTRKWYDEDNITISYWGKYQSPHPSYETDKVYILEQRNGKSGYDGTGQNNLEEQSYISIGHYQAIDDEFKERIKSGDRYIAENIQVFGGDCHINLFDNARILPDGTHAGSSSSYSTPYGDITIVPLQSKYMTDLRFGRFSKLINIGISDDRIGFIPHNINERPFNHTELMYEGQEDLFESFLINKGYVDETANFPLAALSRYSSRINEHLNRIRYSKLKSVGSLIDSFTSFPPFNFIDIPGENGYLTNIRTKGNRIFIWLINGIAYIPVSEKALATGEVGETIYLGIGGKFERVDEMHKTFGNQHKFGLCETDDKWFWYDAYRKTLLSMTFNGKLTQESIVQGMDTFFQNDLPDNVPINIYSGFNPKEKLVFFSFFNDLVEKTISINNKTNKFNGYSQFISGGYATWLNDFYTTRKDKYNLYRHNISDSLTMHDIPFNSSIKIVVNDNDMLKKFMNIIFKGSNEFFNKMKYESQFDFNTNTFLNIAEEDFNEMYYRYIIDEWSAGIPSGNLGRMAGRYLVVTLTVNDGRKSVRLVNMNTNYLKQY